MSDAWSDLVDYLEEIHMADNVVYPVPLRGAIAISDAHALALALKAWHTLGAVRDALVRDGYPGWSTRLAAIDRSRDEERIFAGRGRGDGTRPVTVQVARRTTAVRIDG